MKKTISLALALVMGLSLVMVPGVLSVSAEEAGPVQLKFHYSREDGAYDEWDLYAWGAITGAAAFVEEESKGFFANLWEAIKNFFRNLFG